MGAAALGSLWRRAGDHVGNPRRILFCLRFPLSNMFPGPPDDRSLAGSWIRARRHRSCADEAGVTRTDPSVVSERKAIEEERCGWANVAHASVPRCPTPLEVLAPYPIPFAGARTAGRRALILPDRRRQDDMGPDCLHDRQGDAWARQNVEYAGSGGRITGTR